MKPNLRLRRLFTAADGRIGAAWRGLVPAVVAHLAQLVGAVGLFVVANPGGDGPASTPVALATVTAMGLLTVVATGVALLVSARLDGRSYAEYGFGLSSRWMRDFSGGIAIGISMACAVAAYLHVRGYATVVADVSTGDGTSGPLLSLAAVGVLLFYFLANNVYEEVIFRAVMLRNFAEGLSARGLGLLAAVGGATAASLVAFGAFHPLPPGGGGGVDVVATSAGLGLVFALAYVLAGDLSLPIGVHFGGVFLLSMSQQEIFGLALPSVVVLDAASVPTYEVLAVRVLVGVALVLGWATLFYGGPSVHDSLRPRNEESR